jgi:hypothetical protein
MSVMCLKSAKKLLPSWARGLSPHDDKDALTVSELRSAVRHELRMYHLGQNPLRPIQVAQLENWMLKTQ